MTRWCRTLLTAFYSASNSANFHVTFHLIFVILQEYYFAQFEQLVRNKIKGLDCDSSSYTKRLARSILNNQLKIQKQPLSFLIRITFCFVSSLSRFTRYFKELSGDILRYFGQEQKMKKKLNWRET